MTTDTDKNASVFLTAAWRDLVMVSYEVDPPLLQPLVPGGVTLDTFEGRTFVSLVAFRFENTRVLGVPIPFHRAFEEANLRFYVRRDVPGEEPRRGVVFVKEIVPRRAVALIARALYGENYVRLPMRHEIRDLGDEHGEAARHVAYEWCTEGTWSGIRVGTRGDPRIALAGSEAAFITEHYWGYARQREGSTREYRVEHSRWRVWQGVDVDVHVDAAALYGARFAAYLQGPPSSAFVADGSEVLVRRPSRLSLGALEASDREGPDFV